MRSIINVFGRSPFIPLQMHMEKVASCVKRIPGILDAYRQADTDKVASLSSKISDLEYEADIIKHDIQDNLPRGLFMPIDRANLLNILTIQDSIANRAENIGVLLTFKQAKSFPEFDKAFDNLLSKSIETFDLAKSVIEELDELLESGFGGVEAKGVRKLIDDVARKEYESDICLRELLRLLLANEDNISYGDFFLWTRIIRQVGGIADRSDNLAAALRMTLESS
jgi:predicted phosphate transport protein (TIGR00153 family)